jgi:hypothetical protein
MVTKMDKNVTGAASGPLGFRSGLALFWAEPGGLAPQTY